MKAYKLTTLDNKSYVVATINVDLKTGGKYSLKYGLDKETKKIPGTVGIMCFETVEDALSFTEKFREPYRLYEIEGIGINEIPKISAYLNTKILNRFYKNKKNDSGVTVPEGTICFDSIILKKELKIIISFLKRRK
jgi:hypothetical protein